MAARKKGRHKLHVRGRLFLWYVNLMDEGPMLHVYSEDKRMAVQYTVGQGLSDTHTLKVLGQEFPRQTGAFRIWFGVPCPAWLDDTIITPGFVRRLIDWCMEEGERSLSSI